jgi:glycosyltransferase involved in cell wall biosynthesis
VIINRHMHSNETIVPFFSIGVTTYNRIGLLRQTLISLLEQDFKDFEILIGNDYTTCLLTNEMIDIYDDRVRIINHEINLGELENMNSLLKQARGKYFSWQFDDDLCAPTFLSEMYKALLNNNFPVCGYSSYLNVYGNEKHIFMRYKVNPVLLLNGSDFLRLYIKGKFKVLGLGGVYKTDYLNSIGGAIRLSEGKIALYSEYLLIFQIGLLNETVFVNSPLIGNRVHENSWSFSNRDLEVYRQAGINLLRECLKIFSNSILREDFEKNLTFLLKLILSSFISKGKIGANSFSKKDIEDFIDKIEYELTYLKDIELYNYSRTSIHKVKNYIPLFYFKSFLRGLMSSSRMGFARGLIFFIHRYIKKIF